MHGLVCCRPCPAGDNFVDKELPSLGSTETATVRSDMAAAMAARPPLLRQGPLPAPGISLERGDGSNYLVFLKAHPWGTMGHW